MSLGVAWRTVAHMLRLFVSMVRADMREALHWVPRVRDEGRTDAPQAPRMSHDSHGRMRGSHLTVGVANWSGLENARERTPFCNVKRVKSEVTLV